MELFETFTTAELEAPTARKFVGQSTIYQSRRFRVPNKMGDVVLSDFGSAVRGDVVQNHDAQPNVYRCAEVMLEAPGVILPKFGTSALWLVPVLHSQ